MNLQEQEDPEKAVSSRDFPVFTDRNLFNDHRSGMPQPDDIAFSDQQREQSLLVPSENAHDKLKSCDRWRSRTTRFTRSSTRPLNYQKLRRTLSTISESPETQRKDGSCGGSGKCDNLGQKASSSRWNVLMFGLARFPAPEMELKDIKSRQVRHIPATMFHPMEAVRGGPVKQSRRRGSGCLLRALSCRDDESVGATPPFGVVPEV